MISYTAPASVANSNQPNGPTLTKDVFLGGPMGAQIFCSLTNLNGSLGGLFFYGCDYHSCALVSGACGGEARKLAEGGS